MKLFVLGNGFSIDLVKRMEKKNLISKNAIDLVNLFSKGNCVTTAQGDKYLSMCQHLVGQGVSSELCDDEAKGLIDMFITSYNVYSKWRQNNSNISIRMHIGNSYFELYNELLFYLKNLFIYYNNLVTDDALRRLIRNNEMPFIGTLRKAMQNGEHVNIITYNYDVFLERILDIADISYSVYGIGDDKSYVTIYKPHGSISFDTKQADYRLNIWEGLRLDINQIVLAKVLNNDFRLCAIIPPYGDANHSMYNWARAIRKGIEEISISDYDELCLFGISYGEIDRPEIDSIVLKAKERTLVRYINPKPSKQLCFVLKSLFDKYEQFGSINERNETYAGEL